MIPNEPEPGEVLTTPMDKRAAGAGFPGEGYQRLRDANPGRAPGRAALWNATEVAEFRPAPVWGAYPKGFVDYAMTALRCLPTEILHVCSGMLTASEVRGGTRVDLRAAAAPDVMADGRRLPFRDDAFGGVLIDPPYSVEYAEILYSTDYPRPSHLLAEASRVVKPCGRVGFVHFLVPMVGRASLRYEYTRGVTQGCGYRIRAFTVFVKPQDELGDELAM